MIIWAVKGYGLPARTSAWATVLAGLNIAVFYNTRAVLSRSWLIMCHARTGKCPKRTGNERTALVAEDTVRGPTWVRVRHMTGNIFHCSSSGKVQSVLS